MHYILHYFLQLNYDSCIYSTLHFDIVWCCLNGFKLFFSLNPLSSFLVSSLVCMYVFMYIFIFVYYFSRRVSEQVRVASRCLNIQIAAHYGESHRHGPSGAQRQVSRTSCSSISRSDSDRQSINQSKCIHKAQ